MTPLLRPVWWRANAGSFSSTATEIPGNRSVICIAVDNPTMPPPITARSKSAIDLPHSNHPPPVTHYSMRSRSLRTGFAALLRQVLANLVAAEIAKATAMLVALAAAASVVTAIELAVIPEAIVGAVDSLPGRSPPASAHCDSVVEALIRLIAGATERD